MQNDVKNKNLPDEVVLAHTAAWLERVVIGLNLCPFAKGPWNKGTVRLVCSRAANVDELEQDLQRELVHLAAAAPDEIETTVLVHPDVLQDFYSYNAFLEHADQVLMQLQMDGILQIASFHPDYQFADSQPDDIENYTNRTPYPCLHLLREESIDRAVQAFPDAEEIYKKNIKTMQKLGKSGWQKLCPWHAEHPSSSGAMAEKVESPLPIEP